MPRRDPIKKPLPLNSAGEERSPVRVEDVGALTLEVAADVFGLPDGVICNLRKIKQIIYNL